MIKRNEKTIITFELVKSGYVAFITLDKSDFSKAVWSFKIESALGQPVPYGFGENLPYYSETKIAHDMGEMIDNYINHGSIVNPKATMATTSMELKTKFDSSVEEMHCDSCDEITGHMLKRMPIDKKAWTCTICNNQKTK